jgi:hypothetical protein
MYVQICKILVVDKSETKEKREQSLVLLSLRVETKKLIYPVKDQNEE